MKKKTIPLIVSLWALSLVAACVTVNVYFPAREVEKKAGEIVDDIRLKEPAPAPTSPKSSVGVFWAYVDNYGLVYAQKESRGSNPVIQALKAQIRERFPRLVPFFQKGGIGEAKNGYIEIRDISGLSANEKNELKALVEAENRDRRTVYLEVAKGMNITADQMSKVERIFSGKWQNSAEKGWWIQREDGQWVQK
jgi:uncharacterized protein YdbL (DUF1318 family)